MSHSFSIDWQDIRRWIYSFFIYIAPTFLAVSGQIEVPPQYTLAFSVVLDLLRRYLSDHTKDVVIQRISSDLEIPPDEPRTY
jgi:uncharacterized protein involved in exopolysaccharide biosynthesis